MARDNKWSFMPVNLTPTIGAKPQTISPHKPGSVSVRFDGAEGLDNLTANSKAHLEGRIQDFTAQVIAEARAIEQREHAGKGPPEVTAAHIDEAWWVIRRRIRRARHPILTVAARAFQSLGVAGIGIGATIIQKKWGAYTFVASCLATMAAFLLEAFAARRD